MQEGMGGSGLGLDLQRWTTGRSVGGSKSVEDLLLSRLRFGNCDNTASSKPTQSNSSVAVCAFDVQYKPCDVLRSNHDDNVGPIQGPRGISAD